MSDLALALESERYRSERLEEQINDLTELHQNEIENLKQTMADMEEKVQYQSDERLRDINEMLDICQTRVSMINFLICFYFYQILIINIYTDIKDGTSFTTAIRTY